MDPDNIVKFNKDGLVPAIAQEADTGEVLMLAWMNREALDKTLSAGFAHYWSRSRNCLWKKGETSGNLQEVVSLHIDCDSDTVLLKVRQKGNACHTGSRNCFFNEIPLSALPLSALPKCDGQPTNSGQPQTESAENDGIALGSILDELYSVIKDRITNPKAGSYTNYLLEKGLDKILKKVGEESAEVIIASKNRSHEEMVYEISDLLYHLLVLMVDGDISLEDIAAELRNRRK